MGRSLMAALGLAFAFALAASAAAPTPATSPPGPAAIDPRLALPRVGLATSDLALVVNDDDPASIETGRYYAARRGIAAERVIHVRFAPGQPALSRADFERVKAVVDARAGAEVQAFALAWTLPFRVECMSITSAFAFGFDPAYCAEGCQPTKPSPYYDSRSTAPWTDHRMRPAMLLAGHDVAGVKTMIDLGLRSDERWPEGKAYLLSTGDRKRNVRAETYPRVRSVLGSAYPMQRVDDDALTGKTDVMFYFTGVQRVAAMATNRFLDGAIADHLTSLGGILSGSSQTSVLDWLAAGATGSYGATSEPCNFLAKFPQVGVVMGHYLGGETLIEAYWKSVLMPGQGVFVGDPLARPFGGVRVSRDGKAFVVETRGLPPGRYQLQAARSSIGPFLPIETFAVTGFGVRRLTLPASDPRHFRVQAVPDGLRSAP